MCGNSGTLSEDRFQPYLDQCGGVETDALRLYAWNSAVSAAFYPPLQACEVALRNATDDAIGFRHGNEWYLDAALLDAGDIAMAQTAIDRIEQKGKTATHGRVIAELSFAYWVGLHSKFYDAKLWVPMLHAKFNPRPHRPNFYGDLDRLRTLRNRVAHNEPIYQRYLASDALRIKNVLRRISLPLADWVLHHSRIDATLATAPVEVHAF